MNKSYKYAFDVNHFFEESELNPNAIKSEIRICKLCVKNNAPKFKYSSSIGVSSNLQKHVESKHKNDYLRWLNENELNSSGKRLKFYPCTPTHLRKINLFATPTRDTQIDPFVLKRKLYKQNGQAQIDRYE